MSDRDVTRQTAHEPESADERDTSSTEASEASEAPDATPTGSTGAQHQRTASDRPRTLERMDPNEPRASASPNLHASKRAHSGHKQGAAGKDERARAADDLPEEDLDGPNPHFTP